MSGAPCAKCGRILHTGEARVLIGLTARELEDIARLVPSVSARALCALGLVDPEREAELRAEPDPKADHAFVGDECDCALCGEGWCHYLHADYRRAHGEADPE